MSTPRLQKAWYDFLETDHTQEAADAEKARLVALCPEPYWHETHRYCPVCPWMEAPVDTPELVGTTTVMQRDGDGPCFRCSDDGEVGVPYRGHSLVVDGAVWDDMGRPDTITVTIQPGDALNAPSSVGGQEQPNR